VGSNCFERPTMVCELDCYRDCRQER
jgi:hypothetical protein